MDKAAIVTMLMPHVKAAEIKPPPTTMVAAFVTSAKRATSGNK